MQKVEKVFKAFDLAATKLGQGCAWLIPPLMLIIMYDVIMRKVFNAPSAWAFDITYMIAGVTYVFIMSWTWIEKGHVAIDIAIKRFSLRTQDIIAATYIPVLGITLMAIMVRFGITQALNSQAKGEYSLSPVHMPMYPLRWTIPIGFGLLLLCVIGTWVRTLYRIKTGKSLETGEEVEGYRGT
jgi:TRAP-type mannitol/chloroaromatic compound transport system permease small subunit